VFENKALRGIFGPNRDEVTGGDLWLTNNYIHTEASSLQPHLSVDPKASKPWTSLGYFPWGGGTALAYKLPFMPFENIFTDSSRVVGLY
jgi:hypothetical protein